MEERRIDPIQASPFKEGAKAIKKKILLSKFIHRGQTRFDVN
jgi:hypothetical protein